MTKDYGMIGGSEQIQEVRDQITALISKPASFTPPIFIKGESGTGKELVARAIHQYGQRKDHGFIAVNSTGIPLTLAESELFGYVKGAFTDAREDKEGLFQAADGGVLYLDEISDMHLRVQAKLLRALQNGQVTPVGSTVCQTVDVHVITAASQSLEDTCTEGRFRKDLFYRLKGCELYLPPLRERKEDIPLLADHFLAKCNKDHFDNAPYRFGEGVMTFLQLYNWPGNVRELQNAIEGAIALKYGSTTLELEDMRIQLKLISSERRKLKKNTSSRKRRPTRNEMNLLTEEFIRTTLRDNDGNIHHTASALGIARNTLYKKMRKLGIDRKQYIPKQSP